MASPATSVRDYIVGLGLGIGYIAPTGTQYGIVVGKLNANPDRQIALYDSVGEHSNPKFLLDYPHFQVVVRGPKDDYSDGHARAKMVKDAILGVDPIFINGDYIDAITMLSDTTFLKYDDNNRPLFSTNYRMILRPATNAITRREVL